MVEKQRTIKKEVTLSGVGLHTGKTVNITFKPAEENTGYRFQRIDVEGQPMIKADVDNVVDVSRGTTIEENGVRVATVEHTLAAVAGLSIDNIIIQLDGPETPIVDGSSQPFVDALLEAGIQEQNAEREYFELKKNVKFKVAERDVEMIALPGDDFRVTALIDFNSPVLGSQHASLENMDEFKDEIASCRTFCFLHELEELVKNDLIKGGDLNNAIVIVDRVVTEDELDKLAKLFNKPKVEVKKEGILNNVKLRYPNEPARHKLLDIIGDLALIGTPLKGHIIATRPGHAANVEFAKKIKQLIKEEKIRKKKGVPVFDLNKTPLYDINQIASMLPHRYPFLLIDRILELTDKKVVGLKNVTMNEQFFEGHFPGNPVMPGVLQMEAMAQAGGIFALSTVPDPHNYMTYFIKIDNVRFKRKVVPGDTLIFDLELLTPIRRGIVHMRGSAYVGNNLVMEGEMMAQIAKEKND